MRSFPAGFTLMEVVVALVVLTVLALAVSTTSQYTARIMRLSNAEIEAARMVERQLEAVRTAPYDSLVSGERVVERGAVRWAVEDSGSFRRVVVIVEPAEGTGAISDTTVAYRVKP